MYIYVYVYVYVYIYIYIYVYRRAARGEPPPAARPRRRGCLARLHLRPAAGPGDVKTWLTRRREHMIVIVIIIIIIIVVSIINIIIIIIDYFTLIHLRPAAGPGDVVRTFTFVCAV